MRIHLAQICLGAFVATWALAPAAYAFSTQDKDATDPYNLPKFDLEEQSRNFRTGSTGASSINKNMIEIPFGAGTLQMGVQQGSPSYFTPGPGPTFGLGSGPEPRNAREDFNRVVTPENLR